MPKKNTTRIGETDSASVRVPDTTLVPPVSVNLAHDEHQPLLRPQRRRRRSKADRGLPPDDQLADLARVYLQRQRKHWPQMVEAGLLAEPTEAVVAGMVADFKDRHRTGTVDAHSVCLFQRICVRLGGAYGRYSCDNSNPQSIPDQLVNMLDKAKSEERFIPWSYVFADYSVTGLDAARQGYSSYKKVLADSKQLIETTYIDDFSRASRDELEWWKLAALSKRLNKRMIGASDGFDISNTNWDIMVTVYGLLSRMFIKGLREKVKRGMKGAARRGTCLGKLPLGFTRQPRRDSAGNVVTGPDGLAIHEPCIDSHTREYREQMFDLFVNKAWSPYRIARHYCELKVDGWEGWTESAIRNLLKSPSAIGVFIWNRKRREFDVEEEKWVTIKNPRSDWEVFYSRSLAIVPQEIWRAARRKLAALRRASPFTGRKWSRNQTSSSTLFSGTLFCKYCGSELKLIRSAGRHKQLGCFHGIGRHHECKLTCSKSARVVEECLLGFWMQSLLSEETVAKVVKRANEYLKAEARKPSVDTTALKAEARALEAKIRKMITRIEDTDNDELSQGYHCRVVELQKQLNRVKSRIRETEGTKLKVPKPLTMKRAKEYLAKLRNLLNQDVAAAAEAIRQLTGPIQVRQEPIPGKSRGARWIATFRPDLLRALRFAAGDTAITNDVESAELEVIIEKVPAYEKLAPRFKELAKNGASIATIASSHKMCRDYAKQILEFAETGVRPKWKSGSSSKGKNGKGAPRMRYKEIAEEVAKLREQDKMPFTEIAKKVGAGYSTVVRAFDFARPAPVTEAAENGTKPHRGSISLIGKPTEQKIRRLLRAGKSAYSIIKSVNCSSSSVYRVRAKMLEEGWTPETA